ncbi:MAG TPA: zinc ribbon domain-containing protein [Gemmatimonadaceae bacterium]|nr:zinc ribbon domain-containing protein [Gemmatimonadaceae bacterium]
MFKSLRVPEKLFSLAMWVVSLLFASFLIGLGGKLVGDLPGVQQYITPDQFLDSAQIRRSDLGRVALRRRLDDLGSSEERARLTLQAASNAYRTRRESFSNWIQTRTATTNPQQDPEVVRRTHELDELNAAQRAAQAEVDRLEGEQLTVRQSMDSLERARATLQTGAQRRYERARFGVELRVFLIRLAITLPLLLVAWWLVLRKRRSPYWPLARGFVLFAVFTFFVELVPYLPSYGGYVRYGVGVLLTAVAAVYAIRAMRRYLARRAAEEQRTESERRRALDYEEGIKRVTAGVCPGCERAIATSAGGAPVNYCVHCGMTLFDTCAHCNARKNAFFLYCPSCGQPAAERALTPTS